jgi:hypothetical protein
MENSTMIPQVVVSLETWIRIGIELPIAAFALSLVICLLIQFLRKNKNFNSAFFQIYSVLAFCECGSNLVVSTELFNEFDSFLTRD